MRKKKALIGIGLIVLSVAGLLFWEMKGREIVLTESVLVATETIPAGTVVDTSRFSVRSVPRENLIEGAITEKNQKVVEGKTVARTVPANSQICSETFRNETESVKEGMSIFVLPEEWIAMRSASLRKGDWIDIYGAETMEPLGTYQVAFVRDKNDLEVTNADGRRQEDFLQRGDGCAEISRVEVVAELEQYRKIRVYCTQPYGTLLLIQKGAKLS